MIYTYHCTKLFLRCLKENKLLDERESIPNALGWTTLCGAEGKDACFALHKDLFSRSRFPDVDGTVRVTCPECISILSSNGF